MQLRLQHSGLLLSLILGAAWLPASAEAQTASVRVVETTWGFDGTVVPGQFNPVTVLIDNLTDEPMDGTVQLQFIAGMIRRSGGTYTQPVYLAATTRRWVQLYPYIPRETGTWSLTYRVDDRTYDLGELTHRAATVTPGANRSQTVPPVSVILDPPGMARQTPTTVKHMQAEIFPPYATATLGLQILFLDHVPNWETPRQQALMSWLNTGGRLHLLRNSNGEDLQFPSEMAELNQPFPRFLVGSGTVTRHDIQRNDLTRELVDSILGTAQPEVDEDAIQKELERRQADGLSGWQRGFLEPANTDEQLLVEMRRLTQPEHAWWLILLLSVGYILLIFPGCWLLSQKRTLHYLTTYGAITGVALVFSLIFLLIGRRGYGESTVAHTVAIARFEGPEHCNLMQWSSLFVTSGDTYEISSDDQQSLYCAGTEEAVDARISTGNQGRVSVGIPPFSAQSFLARRRIPVPGWDLQVTEVEVSVNGLVRLIASAGPEFPSGEETNYYVLYRDRLYQMSFEPGTRILTVQGSLPRLNDFCLAQRSEEYMYTPFGTVSGSVAEDDPRSSRTRFFDDSVNRLMHRSLLDDGVTDPLQFVLPPDRLRLYVYTPMPEAMYVSVSTDVAQHGRVLFVRDLPAAASVPVVGAD